MDKTSSSKALLLLSAFLLLLVVCSCSASNNKGAVTEEEYPDMRMENVQYILGRPGEKELALQASSMSVWSDKGVTVFTDVTFIQENEDGTPSMTGSCANAEITTESSDAYLSGNVFVNVTEGNVSIYSENLSWNNEKQKLSTDGEVTIKYDNNTEIRGVRFSALPNQDLYEFGEIISGRIEQ